MCSQKNKTLFLFISLLKMSKIREFAEIYFSVNDSFCIFAEK